MDSFDYIKYLKEGRIYEDGSKLITEAEEVSEKKYKQGYDDREDESLGARRGAEKGKKQSFKDRRDDSYGKFGKRDAEAKGKDKGPGKNKVNKENVEETAPGFTHDCAAHVMHESHGFGLCLEGRHTLVETTEGHAEVTHYDVMFKSGNVVEKIPVNELKVITSEAHHHGKEEKDLEEVGKGYFKKEFGVGKKGFKMADRKKLSEDILSIYEKVQEGSYPFDECIADNEGKYGEEGAKKVCGAIRAAYGEGLEEKKELPQSIKDKEARDAEIEAKKSKGMIKMEDLKAEVREAIFDALSEESQYNDTIYSEDLSEQEDDVDVDVDVEDEVEADVDVDVKDKVNVDAEGDEIDIEKKAVKAKVEVGLSPEEEIVQDSLKAAMDAAEAMGSEVLADQIGNTITYFTRQFVVGSNSD